MKVFTSARSRRRALAILAAAALGLVALYVALRRWAPFVFDATQLQAWIESFGVFAPLVFTVVQTVQVVVAPIPGQITALVGGVLFGPVMGVVYSMTGVMVGSAVAFSISKRWGRPAVERLIDPDLVEAFDGFVHEVGIPGLFLFVLVPGLPDDAICFLAGLSPFGLLTFLGVMTVGRLPSYVVTNFAGDSLANGQLLEASLALVVVVGASSLAYLKREEIKRFASRL